MKRSNLKNCVVLLLLTFSGAHAYGEEKQKSLYVTPKIGFSEFTGVLGVEVQHNHFALDIGLPLSGGVRYYFRPHKHSWFAGLYGSGWGHDDDETIDGVTYTHYSRIEGGLGGGYRWFWKARWNLELGATVGYAEERRSNAYGERIETIISLSPLATVGFSF